MLLIFISLSEFNHQSPLPSPPIPRMLKKAVKCQKLKLMYGCYLQGNKERFRAMRPGADFSVQVTVTIVVRGLCRERQQDRMVRTGRPLGYKPGV